MKAATVLIAVESVVGKWAEVESLLAEHYEEIAHDKHAIPLVPNFAAYEAMEKRGEMIALTARIEGLLIGYSAFFVRKHLHYASTTFASNDVLFVTKPYRNTLVGLRLIAESEKKLREMGVVKIMWHIKPEHDWSALLLRRDYKIEDTIYGKLL